MEQAVWHYIETYGLLEERREVGVALSGGPDSMALLICLRNLSRDHSFTVTAVHLDHGTRGGVSSQDAQFVADFCREHDIPLILGKADVPQTAATEGIGLELAGRREREAFFERTVQSGAVDVVATAHHMDDNAESVMLHLIRGCGTRGLGGIRPRRGVLIRPLLCVTRCDIEHYIEKHGIPFVTDASNEDTSFDRNFLRQELMPRIRRRLNPSFSRAAARLSKTAAEDEEFLTACSRELLDSARTSVGSDFMRINAAQLGRGHPAVAGRAVREALRRLGRIDDVEQVHIEAVLKACRSLRTGMTIMLGGGLQAEISYGELRLGGVRKPPAAWETPICIPGRTILPNGAVLDAAFVQQRGEDTRGELRVYIDADKIPENASVRLRQPGDVFRPLGGPGTKKLKDFYIDRKVPRAQRSAMPVLADGENVLWVIGSALSEDLAVRESASKICRLTYESGNCSWAEEENAAFAGSGDKARAACEEV